MEKATGWCRRFPPIATAQQMAYQARAAQHAKQQKSTASGQWNDQAFPLTREDEWCGEYKAK